MLENPDDLTGVKLFSENGIAMATAAKRRVTKAVIVKKKGMD